MTLTIKRKSKLNVQNNEIHQQNLLMCMKKTKLKFQNKSNAKNSKKNYKVSSNKNGLKIAKKKFQNSRKESENLEINQKQKMVLALLKYTENFSFFQILIKL